MKERQTLVAAGLGLVVVAGGAWLFTRGARSEPPIAMAAEVPEDEGDAAIVDWCAQGLEPIRGGGCFAPAKGSVQDAPIVLYLHGMYERTAGVADELDRQHRVAARATARGFNVLALRGREGECNARPELATWFCWPSNERTAHDAPELVRAWSPALRETERRAGKGPRYVLGFSNGAFFAGLLAVGAHFDAAGFAVANGGPVEPVHALGAKVPLLLMSADEDESQEGMIRFDAELTKDEWPHEIYARGGGHALHDEDIDAALTFFTRSQREKLPFTPPLSAHRPQPHARDSAPPSVPVEEDAEASTPIPSSASSTAVPLSDDHAPREELPAE